MTLRVALVCDDIQTAPLARGLARALRAVKAAVRVLPAGAWADDELDVVFWLCARFNPLRAPAAGHVLVAPEPVSGVLRWWPAAPDADVRARFPALAARGRLASRDALDVLGELAVWVDDAHEHDFSVAAQLALVGPGVRLHGSIALAQRVRSFGAQVRGFSPDALERYRPGFDVVVGPLAAPARAACVADGVHVATVGPALPTSRLAAQLDGWAADRLALPRPVGDVADLEAIMALAMSSVPRADALRVGRRMAEQRAPNAAPAVERAEALRTSELAAERDAAIDAELDVLRARLAASRALHQ